MRQISRIHQSQESKYFRLKQWFYLCIWFLGIFIFIFGIAPWLQVHISSVNQLSAFIRESGIDAGAIYYTEVEEVSRSDRLMRNTFDFFIDEKSQ